MLKNLVTLSKQEERKEAVAKEKGLTTDEFSFYGLLEPYENELFSESDEKRCQITKEIVTLIVNKRVVDWVEKEDVQKEMRRDIKNLLRKIGFPSDKLELFTREVLELARTKF